jgi:hypothetical protein
MRPRVRKNCSQAQKILEEKNSKRIPQTVLQDVFRIHNLGLVADQGAWRSCKELWPFRGADTALVLQDL